MSTGCAVEKKKQEMKLCGMYERDLLKMREVLNQKSRLSHKKSYEFRMQILSGDGKNCVLEVDFNDGEIYAFKKQI